MARRDCGNFPKLVICSDDVYGSWKNWLTEFKLCVEMSTFKMGKEKVTEGSTERMVDVFRGRMKLVALLSAIDRTGREALTSLGFNIEDQEATYEQAMAHLVTVYGGEETVYVETMKFVTASQALGENENDYLLRIESLSRKMNFGTNNDLREEFALAIAVNGLRESSLRNQLMQKTDLNWKSLCDNLRARKIAREYESILEGTRPG